MNETLIHFHMDGRPEVASFDDDAVKYQFRQPAFFGKAVSSRIALCGNPWMACLTLSDDVSETALAELAEDFSWADPPEVNLTGPIMAIQLIKKGNAWPDSQWVEPFSVLNCRPCEDWVGMEAEPPIGVDHPLLNQPLNTLSIEEEPWRYSVPSRIHYDSIVKVETKTFRVLITSRPTVPSSGLNVLTISTANEALAKQLTEDLQFRRVRRLRCNGAIERIQSETCSAIYGQPLQPRQITAPVALPAAA